jgi:hypothetical protein
VKPDILLEQSNGSGIKRKGEVMFQIKQAVGNVVATDTQSSIETLDRAVAQQSRMCASVIEAAHDSHLAIATTQPLLEALSASVRGLVESRANLAKAVREVAVIQAKSNLRETAFGCPNGTAMGSAVTAPLAEPV